VLGAEHDHAELGWLVGVVEPLVPGAVLDDEVALAQGCALGVEDDLDLTL
jgi:hypothetical protein